MIAGSLLIGAYWGPRRESEESFVNRANDFTRALANVHHLFSEWIFMTGRTIPPKTGPHALTRDAWKLVYSKVDKETGRPKDTGHRLAFCTSVESSQSFFLNITSGATAKWMTNFCCLKFPEDGVFEQLTTTKVLIDVLTINVEAWGADYGVVTNDDMLLAAKGISLPVGWIMYRKGLVRNAAVPAGFHLEQANNATRLLTVEKQVPLHGTLDSIVIRTLERFTEGVLVR